MTEVDAGNFKYQSGNLLSLDSGRQLKSRFGGEKRKEKERERERE